MKAINQLIEQQRDAIKQEREEKKLRHQHVTNRIQVLTAKLAEVLWRFDLEEKPLKEKTEKLGRQLRLARFFAAIPGVHVFMQGRVTNLCKQRALSESRLRKLKHSFRNVSLEHITAQLATLREEQRELEMGL